MNSGICEQDKTSKTMYDEPELWDIKVLERLCKDKVRFITFIMDENNAVLGVVEWSRVGRPYIATFAQEGEKLLKWSSLSEGHFNFFRKTTPHTYICKYNYKIENYYGSPKKLPLWVEKILTNGDAQRRFFDLGIKRIEDKRQKQNVLSVKK